MGLNNLNNERLVVWHPHKVCRDDRSKIKKHKPVVLWFTGLSGSGKSTIANEVDYCLNARGYHTYILDGDNIRHGLNSDLNFSSDDRRENIRRIGEVARLFVDAGLIVITAFISPFAEDRQVARNMMGDVGFVEIYTKCSIEVCKGRDPKGFYKKAISGEIEDFTGISHPYEEPQNPELTLETDELTVDACVDKIITYLRRNKIIES